MVKSASVNSLLVPASWQALRKLPTNQIPINLTKGTASDASEAYVGDFRQLFIGMRTSIRLDVSREASDGSEGAFTNFQVWIRAALRADVAVVRPDHFNLIDGYVA